MTKKVNLASDVSQNVYELFQSVHGEVEVDIEPYETYSCSSLRT